MILLAILNFVWKWAKVVWRHVGVLSFIVCMGKEIIQTAMSHGMENQQIELMEKGVSNVEEYVVQETYRKHGGCHEASCWNSISYQLGGDNGPTITHSRDEKARLVAEIGPRVLQGALSFVEYSDMPTTRNTLLAGKWTFHILDCRYSNAFIRRDLPRHVWISRWLLDEKLDKQDEIAFVLAHEIVHSVVGHGSRRWKMTKTLLPCRVTVLVVTPWLFKPVAMALAIFSEGAFMSYIRRQHELEADLVAIHIAAFSCYDSLSAANFFNETESFGGFPLYNIMDSHPLHQTRYEHMVETIQQSKAVAHAEKECRDVCRLYPRWCFLIKPHRFNNKK